MHDIRLLVNGKAYLGWKSARITRSITAIAGSFDLQVSDRWGAKAEPWAIAEEDECRVQVGADVVLDGYVDRRSLSIAGKERAMRVSGRDRAAVLVDCSAVLDRWSFRQLTAAGIAGKVAEPFGIGVSVQAGVDLPRLGKIAVNPGDSAFSVIRRVAEMSGVLVISDGAGGIELSRAGTARVEALREGVNVLSAAIDYDAVDRYRRYVVISSPPGDDHSSGEDLRVRAEAMDEAVRRPERVQIIRPDTGLTRARARARGDWEARVRAARAESVTIAVVGWQQSSGDLWPVNALCTVQAPSLGVDGDLLISQVTHQHGPEGQTTELQLVRPDAFSPDPSAIVRRAGGKWKKPTGGAA